MLRILSASSVASEQILMRWRRLTPPPFHQNVQDAVDSDAMEE
jgi:hypothetical protein